MIAGREPEELVSLEGQIPAGLFEIRKIKGLGPAKIRALYEGLSISTLGELEHACKENRLITLPGFGEKTQANVLAGVQAERRQDGMHLRDAALEHGAAVPRDAGGVAGKRHALVGDLAMGAELVASIAVLVEGERPAREEIPFGEGVNGVVFHAPAETFGVALVRETSDAGHFAALKVRAKELGLTLEDDRLVGKATPSDASLYEALDLHFVPVEARREGAIFARKGKAPKELIARGDLRGALHNHTLASDGTATLAQMRGGGDRVGSLVPRDPPSTARAPTTHAASRAIGSPRRSGSSTR